MLAKIAAITFLFTFILCVLGNFNLTIVHISDFHSHWEEFDENKHDCSKEESEAGKCYGGFARLLTFVRDIRKKEKNVLVLSSGEFFMGKSMCPLHGWRMGQALLPKLELDAMSLSNHDFDSGIFFLSTFLYAMKFPVLCANMIARNTSFLYSRVNKSVVLDVNGEKVGIVGYIHRHALKKSLKVVSLKFVPETPALQEEVSRLESEGVDKIIALGHAGYFTDLEIAKNVKGVDIVMGGDSDIMLFDPGQDADELSKVGNIHGNYPRVHHQEPESADDPSLVNRTLVLHIPQHGMYVGVLRATFDDNGKIIHESGEPVLLDSSIPQDEATIDFIEWAKGALEEANFHGRLPDEAEILGVARGHLDGNRRRCRMQECSLGNFIADAMLHEFTFHYRNKSEDRYEDERWGPIDALVINSGPILRSIESGPIQIKDIVKSIYLGGYINRVYMSGQQVVDMMEHSVKHYDPSGVTAPGSFLQIAGLKVEYDLSRPSGRRVRSLMIRCRDCGDDNTYYPITHYKTYIIGMPKFLHNGQDGFYDFEDFEHKDEGQFDVVLIVEHLRRVYEIIPKIDGRIKFYKSNSQPDSFAPPLLFGEPALEYNKLNGIMIPPEHQKEYDNNKERKKSDTTEIFELKTQKEHEGKSSPVEVKHPELDSHLSFETESPIKVLNNSEDASKVNIENLTHFKNVYSKVEKNSLEIIENDIVSQKDETITENSLNKPSLSEGFSNLSDESKDMDKTYDSSKRDIETFQNNTQDIGEISEIKENIVKRSKEKIHATETEISPSSVTNDETRIFNTSKISDLIKELLNSTPEKFKYSLENFAEQLKDIPGGSDVLEKMSRNLTKNSIEDWLNNNVDMENNWQLKNNISNVVENLDKFLTRDMPINGSNTMSNEKEKSTSEQNSIRKIAAFMKLILGDYISSGLFKNHTKDINAKNTTIFNSTDLTKNRLF